MADTPEAFDVIVMPNLYGDILSDVAAQIAGSVGLAGSANIGDKCAMFEAIHGSAPRRAGQNLANPSGLLLGAVLMLVHIDQPEAAERVHNAWLRTIEDGIHTYDVFTEGVSTQKVGTKEFACAVVARHGAEAEPAEARECTPKRRGSRSTSALSTAAPVNVETRGIDVFVYWPSRNRQRTGSRHRQTRRRWPQPADDRQPRRQGLARAAAPRRSAPIVSAAASSPKAGQSRRS